MPEKVAGITLSVDSRGVTRARDALGRFTKNAGAADVAAGGFSKTMLKAGLIIGGVAVATRTATKAFRFIVDVSKEFEQSMAGVEAVTRATEMEMDALEKTARRLGSSTVFSAKQAAEGMRFLGMAGFETNEIISAMPGLLDLAASSGIGLAEAADIASNVLSGFNLDASESGRVADVLAATASSANTSVLQLGEGLKFVAPIAAAFGLDIEEVSAAIGVMSDAGLQASLAGTGLRVALAQMAMVTDKAQTALDRYGITAEQINPETHELADTIQLLADAGLGAADAIQIFGIRGAPAILAMTSQVSRLKELNTEFDNAAGRAREMADVMSDTLTGDLRLANSAIEELALSINDKLGLTESLRIATQAATALIQSLGNNQTIFSLAIADEDLVATSQALQDSLNSMALSGSDFARAYEDLQGVNERILGVSKEQIAAQQDQLTLSRLLSAHDEATEETQIGFLESQIMHIEEKIRLRKEEGSVANVAVETERQAALAQQEELKLLIAKKAANDSAIAETEAFLATEEQLIRSAYERQIQLVENNVTSITARAELIKALNIQLEEELNSVKGGPSGDLAVERVRQQLLTEEEAIRESYERRKQIILDATTITETEKNELLDRLGNQQAEQIQQRQIDQWSTALSSFDDFQNNLLTLARTGNKDLARVFKAAAIANTVIKTYESATSAYAAMASIPYIGPALGAAAAAAAIAAGLANVQAIKAQPIGQFARGGILGGNNTSGDSQTFKGNSREAILTMGQQREFMDLANGKGGRNGGQAPIINIFPMPGQTADVQPNSSGGVDVHIRQNEAHTANSLATGTGPIDKALTVALRQRGVA